MGRKRDPQPQQQGANAFVEEGFVPGFMDIVATENGPGQPATVRLRMFYAPVGPSLFVFARTATLDPEHAIEIGEILAREGRRVKSGVEIPAIGAVPGDLRQALREDR